MRDEALLKQGYEACRQIMKARGKSYYFATSLFGDIHMKRSTWALYAFFRVPDDIVDEQPHLPKAELERQLHAYRAFWQHSLHAGRAADPQMAAIVDTFTRCKIPEQMGLAFLDSMAMDVDTKRYATYADLERYMYGSAGVVGQMMAQVIGYSDPAALEYAKTLGYAMQLTNFLRDIDEDYRSLGRIYMPTEELAAYGLGEQDIAERRWGAQFLKFMEFQVGRAEQLYHEGNKCLPLLSNNGRFAYKMASVLYSEILVKLKRQGYNPFAGRASTAFAEKVLLLVKAKVRG